MKKRKSLWLLLIVFIISLVLWRIPFLGIIFTPFQLFTTYVHEMGHAVVAMLTGGSVRNIGINLDGSGITWYSGGWGFFITQAGYLGSVLVGAVLLILAASDSPKLAKYTIGVIWVILALSMLFFVRDLVTFILMIVFLLFSGAFAFYASDTANKYLLAFLAIQTCFNSLVDIQNIFGLSCSNSRHAWGNYANDASAMQDMTFIPAPFWTLLWAALSFVVFFLVVKFIYNDE